MKYTPNNFKTIDDAYTTTKTSGIEGRDKALKQYRDDSEQALKDYQSIENIAYGKDEEQILDIILPNQAITQKDSSKKKALFISIHGGYWQEQNHKDGSSMAKVFLEKGAVFSSIHYRLCPKVSLLELTCDCKRALSFLIKQQDKYDFDANQIYLIGHSAGAHLAMVMAAEFKVAGVLLISGIFDLTPIQYTLLNQNIQLKASEIKALSYPSLPPKKGNEMRVMVCYGQLESGEFEKQSKQVFEHYKKHHQNCFYQAYPNLHHFDIITEINNPNSQINQDIDNFWLKNLSINL